MSKGGGRREEGGGRREEGGGRREEGGGRRGEGRDHQKISINHQFNYIKLKQINNSERGRGRVYIKKQDTISTYSASRSTSPQLSFMTMGISHCTCMNSYHLSTPFVSLLSLLSLLATPENREDAADHKISPVNVEEGDEGNREDRKLHVGPQQCELITTGIIRSLF